jgi:hypothetical protein
MANSFVRYTGNGSINSFSITFDYISANHVTCTVNGVPTAFTLSSGGTVATLAVAPVAGAAVQFTRNSSQASRLTDYASGSVLKEIDLDTDSKQGFFLGQEAIDNTSDSLRVNTSNFQWEADNKRITNVASPVNDNDAVNKVFLTTNLPAINTVNSNIANVNSVASNIATINSVNSNSTNINSVASNSANINSAVSNATNINAVVANSANINTAAGANANITAVAGQITPTNNIGTLAGLTTQITGVYNIRTDVTAINSNSANINSVASNITNINAVNSNSANINAVNANSSNINTIATNIGKVNTLYTEIAKVVEVANDLQEAVSEIDTVANNITNVNLVGNNIANVNAVNANSSNINSLVANATNINSVASNSANINLVSGSIANVNIAGANINSVNDFVARYRVSGTQPTTSLDIGDLWFDSTLQKLLIYTSSGWQTASDYVSALINVYRYTATNGQTVFTGVAAGGNTLSFTAEANCFVFLNGIRIVLGQDYTLTGGNTVTLLEAANTGDLLYIEVVAKISITEEAILQGYVTTAGNSATTATTQAGISTAQAVIATTQAGISTAQATTSTTQAGIATTQAGIATTQATNSASSASASASSAANSASSASAAAASASAAAAAAGGGSVSVSATDTTSGRLNTKIVVSGSLTKTVLNSGAAETLQLGVDVIFNETYFTATAGQTTFSTAYTPNYIQCFVNGIKLINTQDFTATNGTSVILSDACVAGDVVEFVKFK